MVDTKRRLTLTRYYGKNCHAYDYDNLVWGFKPIVDQLVSADILIDDSPTYIERIYKQTKSPDGIDHIIIIIEELIERKGKD